jgi:hypothetical protein
MLSNIMFKHVSNLRDSERYERDICPKGNCSFLISLYKRIYRWYLM